MQYKFLWESSFHHFHISNEVDQVSLIICKRYNTRFLFYRYKEEFQDTSYLIGIVPIIKVAYFGAGGGSANSKLPIMIVFL